MAVFYFKINKLAFPKNQTMKQSFFKLLAQVNRFLLPSFSKKQLDLSKASKFQMALIGWRYFVTIRALGQ
ncbi:hypothetical protein SAMN05421766_104564 [Zobellia uliginosa]|uniref:SsrA-binding protein n=2 Tax=Zobellia uliginosa TaxID=143224 RepID=A0ABY1L1D5_9FLAO|nr:hypothetical protein SAMN05421766_104564 [Zobellia uliginosa]